MSLPTMTPDTLAPDNRVIPDWVNWTKNILHKVPDGTYFLPTNLSELKAILSHATAAGASVRVSGRRYSMTPLVACNRRSESDCVPLTYFVDLARYSDLGPDGKQTMVLNNDNTITVNAGVCGDDLVAFLSANKKILPTVTNGGAFSIGGMTSVDVHGCTVAEPIFSETAIAFNFVLSDGTVDTIDETSPSIGDYSPLQFARVNIGALGIVTSVTLRVLDRPFANSLLPNAELLQLPEKDKFVCEMERLLQENQRLEVFFSPYDGSALTLLWNLVDGKKGSSNDSKTISIDYEYADNNEEAAWGNGMQKKKQLVQESGNTDLAKSIVRMTLAEIGKMFNTAVKQYSDLWWPTGTGDAWCIFMAYFIELPDLSKNGLTIVWDGLNAVQKRLKLNKDFLPAAPLVFRFVRGGNAVLAGTYTEEPDTKTFINLELLAFTDEVPSSDYPPELLQFFSEVEQEWVKMGGLPHNGKFYGFFDPTSPSSRSTGAFNSNFIKNLVEKRKTRLAAFENFRKSRDPKGMFSNEYVEQLLGSKSSYESYENTEGA